MTAGILKIAACISFLVIAGLALAQSAKPQPFSADFVLTSPRDKKLVTGRIYVSLPRMRTDMKDQQNQISTFIIFDFEKQVGFAIIPEFHTYSEIRLDGKNQGTAALPSADFYVSNPCAGHTDWKCTKTGVDTVGGRKCDVWQITTSDAEQNTEWVDQKLHFPIQYRRADGTRVTYSNIQERQEPAPSLFQVPPGYRKIEPKAQAVGSQR